MFTHQLTDTAQLRPLDPWRAAEFQDHIARDREHLAEYLPWAESLTTVDATRGWLQAYADRRAADTGSIVGLWLDGTLVGGSLFRVWEPRFGTCEIGVWIELSAQGKGLITRTVGAMLDYAFQERGMHRAEWRNAVTNARSAAVAKRIGMTREGVLREAFPYRGQKADVELWSILAPEWQAG